MNDTEQDVPVVAPAEPWVEPVAQAPPRAKARRPSILELVTNPQGFFEALEASPVSLGVPLLIVLAVGVIAAIAAYLTSSVLLNAVAIPEVRNLGGMFGIIGGISALILTLLFWVIYTAAFFVISMAFNGRGDFNRLLAYVGYGHLPQVLGGVISLVLTWNYLSTLRVPAMTDPQAIATWTSTLMKDPTMRLATAVSLIFLLWSANLWIFGVRSGRKLSIRDAGITVGVPVLLYVLYIIYTLVA